MCAERTADRTKVGRVQATSLACLLTLTCSMLGCSAKPAPEPAAPSATGTPSSRKTVTELARKESLVTKIQLSGQVQATEEKTVLLNSPNDGVVVRPMIKVGSLVVQGQPLVEMNSVYGLTGMQILEKLEAQQGQVVDARSKLSASYTSLLQAQSALGQAQATVSSKVSDLRQAEADAHFIESDLRRKRELSEAGIGTRAEVEEAENRLAKAQALRVATKEELELAKQQVPLAKKNISEFERAIQLGQQAVELSESNFERNRSVLSQSQLVGTELAPELTALKLGPSRSGPAAAGGASSFLIKSPITGVVTKLGVTSGQKLQSGVEVGQVVELSEVYVDANCFEGDVARLHEGDKIEVSSSALGDQKFSGRIRYIGKQVNPATRTIQVRSLISNLKGALRPDTFVDVTVLLPAKADAVVIPERALLTLGNEQFVMVCDGFEKYHKQPVVVGLRSADKVEILKGLKAGEQVVTEGNLLLEAREN